MDHLVNKELARLSHSNSYGQQLNVWMEMGDDWLSSEAGIGTGAV